MQPMQFTNTPHRRRHMAFSSVVAFLVLLVASPAGAQENPYGSTSTTSPPPGSAVSCSVDVSEAQVGSTVTGTVSGVLPNSEVRIQLGSTTVSTETADDGSPTTDVGFSFVVPAVDPGDYPVVASSASFTARCAFPDGGDVLSILAERGSAGAGGGGGSLAFTGSDIALLAAVALALIAVGYAFYRRGKRSEADVR